MINLYIHNGSGNHGCEAIVRGTKELLGGEYRLFSSAPEEDRRAGLEKIVQILDEKQMPFVKWSVERILYSLKLRVPFVNNEYLYVSRMNSVLKAQKGDIYFSIGGDNYCYSNWKYLAHYNKVLNHKKVKTVLWGCSVSPDDINEQMREDLKRYALIIARESITYKALKEINKNIVLNPDPAFYMQTEVVTLPKEFLVGNTIGINLSPMIMGYENNANITFKNYVISMLYFYQISTNFA